VLLQVSFHPLLSAGAAAVGSPVQRLTAQVEKPGRQKAAEVNAVLCFNLDHAANALNQLQAAWKAAWFQEVTEHVAKSTK
jgi:hypothetical protein